MKCLTTAIAAFLLTTAAYGQDHELIFPDLDGQDLFEALADNFTPASVLSYGQARDVLFGIIDKVNDSLYCVYTDWPVHIPPGADPTEAAFQDGQGINTEHAWPRSFGAEQEPARADMHHLFPTRVDVNQARGNLPYGESPDGLTDEWYYLNFETGSAPSSNRDAYSEYLQNQVFEPREDMKGNVARALMYFYTIYRDEANAEGPNFFNEQRATLCQWHEQDPVDAAEFARTLAISQYQDGKPNPFVVDCTLPARLYCTEVPNTSCIVSTRNVDYLPLRAAISPNPIAADRTGRLQLTTESTGTLRIRYIDALGRVARTTQSEVAAGTVSLEVTWPHAGYWYCELLLNTGDSWYREVVPVMVE